MNPRLPRYIVAALGLLWFIQIGGGQTLNPLNTAWLFTGDWRQHWLGFIFFQRDPWTFPLGGLSSLLYPIGTNIGLTDANPLLAIGAKIFSRVTPAEFQLIGPWLAVCFILQGYFGAALASTVTKEPAQQVLGGYLFVLSPILVARLGHDTLCAHWILLALLYCGLREYHGSRDVRTAVQLTLLAVAIAAGAHPYLAAMSLVLAFALAVRLWRSQLLTLPRAVLLAAAAAGIVVTIWWLIGYFGRTPDGASGFGKLSANLLTFIDPREFSSRLLPQLPSTSEQWEGYGFLGLGVIVAVVLGVVALIRQRPARRPGAWAVAAACIGLGIYALSSHITFASHEVLDLERTYARLMPLIKPFRASGRFIWASVYLLTTFGIWGVTRIFRDARSQAATVALALVVILQASDFNLNKPWATRPEDKRDPQVSAALFTIAIGKYQHLALAPTQVLGACSDPYQEDYVYRFMLLAYRLKLTFNSGIFARLDVQRVVKACEAQNLAIDTGALDTHTIYVVSLDELPRFKAADAACGRWDGNWYCVSRASDARFATYIETGKDPGAGPR